MSWIYYDSKFKYLLSDSQVPVKVLGDERSKLHLPFMT